MEEEKIDKKIRFQPPFHRSGKVRRLSTIIIQSNIQMRKVDNNASVLTRAALIARFSVLVAAFGAPSRSSKQKLTSELIDAEWDIETQSGDATIFINQSERTS